MSRYNSRIKGINKNEMYEEIFDDRGIKKIKQYVTPKFKNPSQEQLKRIRSIEKIWVAGDKFWRIAARQYGDPNLWWVIARFNEKPTEGHMNPGDTIKIPIDLSVVLGVLV